MTSEREQEDGERYVPHEMGRVITDKAIYIWWGLRGWTSDQDPDMAYRLNVMLKFEDHGSARAGGAETILARAASVFEPSVNARWILTAEDEYPDDAIL